MIYISLYVDKGNLGKVLLGKLFCKSQFYVMYQYESRESQLKNVYEKYLLREWKLYSNKWSFNCNMVLTRLI